MKSDLKIFIFGLIFLTVIGMASIYKNNKGGGISLGGDKKEEISAKVMEYINKQVLEPQGMPAAVLGTVTEEKGLYKMEIEIQGQKDKLYVTKDGTYIFPSPIFDLTPEPKVAKADVKLFIMSHCPFGLQAEKMYIPVYNLLKDKIDMSINFVNYIMHEKIEIDDNLKQYCIQKEQKEKYMDYLSCFVEAGKTEECLDKTGVDKEKLAACVDATDKEFKITEQYNDKKTWLNEKFPVFPIDEELNKQYNVQGSPTVVINGKVVQLQDRSPEAFKKAICDTLEKQPEECKQALSTTAASAGFGSLSATGTAPASSSGSCQ
ncbi:MAG TPA: hypothetical protein PLA41_00965 [Candidatus Pacearchaeota archaeon]|nr:hypothetical protein [Candidatus Parcubacteria bacterium]HNZ83941.1 hypothetical protein [Candidatus Pacearchaeota archaeon]HOU45702.1 hypothetical protein [Candidatus Pacearchaeota archaeon]HPM08235.1 hypothetical protein [Candidatus Pacearchaeota archaeon]HQI74445.1 hypothetical protein [Candidatus Pacearchaeota archaeon]